MENRACQIPDGKYATPAHFPTLTRIVNIADSIIN